MSVQKWWLQLVAIILKTVENEAGKGVENAIDTIEEAVKVIVVYNVMILP